MPDPRIFTSMGAEGITAMVEEVYLNLWTSPIRGMFATHKDEVLASARKSALFWITVCGGPPLYEEKYGPPRMRMRHQAFSIDESARLHWLNAWYPVLAHATDNYGMPPDCLEGFRAYLEGFSRWMVNTEDGAGSAKAQ